MTEIREINKVVDEHEKIYSSLIRRLNIYKQILWLLLVSGVIIGLIIKWWIIFIACLVFVVLYRLLIIETLDKIDINNMVLEKMKECKENELKKLSK
jgi:hypothetical protein